MEAIHAAAALAAAPGEHEYAGETQGATQQASQVLNINDPYGMERPFFGCLQPCNGALRRIDFLKTNPRISIGRGGNNNFILPGMRISFFHCRLMWDGREDAQSQVVVLDNSTNGTWINGARVPKGQSRILRDGNEIAFGSPMQQSNPLEDYRYIYRHLAPHQLTGVHAHYDIAHELGRGTFATVMKAMSRATGEWCAVKIIHAQKLRGANANNATTRNNNANQLQSLGREISILETLDHPNVCRLIQTFVPEEDGVHDFYLVLEYVEGGDLLDFILEKNGLAEPLAQHLTFQLCSALSYIHSKGITHRDLKPENVLLTKDDPPNVKVADFGLAKAVDSLTMLRTMCGTPNYLAPEVVMEGVRVRGYDQLVDSWSVGVIVFSMLTNTGPFIEDENERDIARRIAGRTINWSMLLEMRISRDAQQFIRLLLEEDPSKRMSLTDALSHQWLASFAASDNGTSRKSAAAQYAMHRSLSDLSELSEVPEDFDNMGTNGEESMLSGEPSSEDVLGVDSLSIHSPAASRHGRRPLERRSRVLARELAAEAEAQAAMEGAAEADDLEAQAAMEGAAEAVAGQNNNGATARGKRRRSQNNPRASTSSGGDSPESGPVRADGELEGRPPKRGKRSQGKQNAVPPTPESNAISASGRVLRSRVGVASGSHR